jgi:hypothetical protein
VCRCSNPNVWHHHDVQLIARSKIIKEIKSYLEKHLVICSPEVCIVSDPMSVLMHQSNRHPQRLN